jgi:hypothetical protein
MPKPLLRACRPTRPDCCSCKLQKWCKPDPDRLDTYQTHRGQRRGQWPSSPEITAAMFERYNKKPNADEPKL